MSSTTRQDSDRWRHLIMRKLRSIPGLFLAIGNQRVSSLKCPLSHLFLRHVSLCCAFGGRSEMVSWRRRRAAEGIGHVSVAGNSRGPQVILIIATVILIFPVVFPVTVANGALPGGVSTVGVVERHDFRLSADRKRSLSCQLLVVAKQSGKCE